MYDIPHFKARDDRELLAFMRDHPFATLNAVSPEGWPVATQVPLFIDERDGALYLSGHIMRKSAHYLALEANPHAMVLFTGPHAYVSASWYTDTKMASTWNYLSVQASGDVRFQDEHALRDILQRTTDHFEGDTESPAAMKHMDPAYVDRMMKAIVAFEMKVQKLEHAFKFSQNRDEDSRQHIILHLENGDAQAREIAAIMRNGKYLSRSAKESQGWEPLTLRQAVEADIPTLARLFRETILNVNSKDYDARQVEVWASAGDDLANWRTRLAEQYFVLSEFRDTIFGFGSLTPDGYLDTMYVDSSHQGMGFGSDLLQDLLQHARSLGLKKIHTQASITAMPFFEKKGFRLVRERVLAGTPIVNYIMELPLD
jgi:transcriptional regulator